MRKKIILMVLPINFLVGLIVMLMAAENFAVGRKPIAQENTSGSVKIHETKQACVDTTNSQSMKKAEMEITHKEMIEEYIAMHLPLLQSKIAFLEKNYKDKRDLGLAIFDLARIRDLQALPVMIEILKNNPRGINRASAANGIRIIEEYNEDRMAIPALVQALDDTITDVQFNAAEALVSLGDTLKTIVLLTNLARGENKEDWTADWGGYMGLENATEEEIEKEKNKFKDMLQFKAIGVLGKLTTKEAVAVLEDLSINGKQEKVRKLSREILRKALDE
jgi:HEAT repeat protein